MRTGAHAAPLFPGLLMSAVVASAATFLSEQYHAPVMLFALLLGMALNFLSVEGACKPGIEFTAREVLRVGVALLGMRITFSQIAALGWHPVALVLLSVVLTIGVSMLAARALGFQTLFGLLTGGATAICGASAALALSASLPGASRQRKGNAVHGDRCISLVHAGHGRLPMLARTLDLNELQAGAFLGATIHDVAQVVGAGYGMSHTTGDVATVVKLMRVAMLLPVIVVASLITRRRHDTAAGARPPVLPWFAVGFLLLAAVNSTGWIAPAVQDVANQTARWCLVIAISALGMKTQLKELSTVGVKPIVLMLGETLFLAGLVLLMLHLGA